jgi:hypothetical protein
MSVAGLQIGRFPMAVRQLMPQPSALDPTLRGRCGADGEKVADASAAGESVWQRQVDLDRVVVATSDASARDVSGAAEFADDSVCGAFGDLDRLADLAETQAGVVSDADEDWGMVGEESPAYGRRTV